MAWGSDGDFSKQSKLCGYIADGLRTTIRASSETTFLDD